MSPAAPTTTHHGPAAGRTIIVNRAGLRFAIKGAGMTHAQVARRAGLASSATVSNLVSPHGRKTCRPETALGIAKALGLSRADMRELFTVVLTTDL